VPAIHTADSPLVFEDRFLASGGTCEDLMRGAGLHGQCDADLIEQRCFLVKGEETIPIFDEYGLAAQLGNVEYARPRKFREKLEQWLRAI
jgi:hypothetical protein